VELTGLTPKIDAKDKVRVESSMNDEFDEPNPEGEYAEILELLNSGHEKRLNFFRNMEWGTRKAERKVPGSSNLQ